MPLHEGGLACATGRQELNQAARWRQPAAAWLFGSAESTASRVCAPVPPSPTRTSLKAGTPSGVVCPWTACTSTISSHTALLVQHQECQRCTALASDGSQGQLDTARFTQAPGILTMPAHGPDPCVRPSVAPCSCDCWRLSSLCHGSRAAPAGRSQVLDHGHDRFLQPQSAASGLSRCQHGRSRQCSRP